MDEPSSPTTATATDPPTGDDQPAVPVPRPSATNTNPSTNTNAPNTSQSSPLQRLGLTPLQTVLTPKEAGERLPDAVGKFLGHSFRGVSDQLMRSAATLNDVTRDICRAEEDRTVDAAAQLRLAIWVQALKFHRTRLHTVCRQAAQAVTSANPPPPASAIVTSNALPILLSQNAAASASASSASSASIVSSANANTQLASGQNVSSPSSAAAASASASASASSSSLSQQGSSGGNAAGNTQPGSVNSALSSAVSALSPISGSAGNVLAGSSGSTANAAIPATDRYAQQLATAAAKAVRQSATMVLDILANAGSIGPIGSGSGSGIGVGGDEDVDIGALCANYAATSRRLEDLFRISTTLDDSGIDVLKSMLAIMAELSVNCLTLGSVLTHTRHRHNLLEWGKQVHHIPVETFELMRRKKRTDPNARRIADYVPILLATYRSARLQLIAEIEIAHLIQMVTSMSAIPATALANAVNFPSDDSSPEEIAFLTGLKATLEDIALSLGQLTKTLRADQPPLVSSSSGYAFVLRLHAVLLNFSDYIRCTPHFVRLVCAFDNGLPHVMAAINTFEEDDRLRTSDGTEPNVYLQLVGVIRGTLHHLQLLVNHVLTAAPDSRVSMSFSRKKFILDETSDISIWIDTPTEEPSSRGNLNSLVRILTSDKTHDPMFLKACIMTYQSFTSSEKFFSKLMERYAVPQTEEYPDEESFKKAASSIKLRVCQVIQNWLETHFSDFNEELIKQLTEFTEVTLINDNFPNVAQKLKTTIEKKMNTGLSSVPYSREDGLRFVDNSYLPLKILQDFPIAEIARQMTLLDMEVYSAIKPVEFLNQAWNVAKFKHRAPNLLYFIQRFNALSNWVASCILWYDDIASRALTWARMISLGEQFKELNNYHLLMAVISGLNKSAVHRLKHTKEEVPKRSLEAFAALEDLMSSESSFKKYREALHHCRPPCMPYIGIYLTDLTHIEDGNPTIIDGQINFDKLKLVYKVIDEVRRYQYGVYPSPKSAQLSQYLSVLPHLEDDVLYRLSLIREPRGAERSDLM